MAVRRPPCLSLPESVTRGLIPLQFSQKKDAETWFKELDINKDGAVNFEEFLILVIKVGVEAHEDIHKE